MSDRTDLQGIDKADPGELRPPQAGGAPVPAATTYRPLSLLAVAGFALAMIYMLLVLGGVAISFLVGAPWLLSFWAVVLPLTALSLSWLALRHIRFSEGTLTGASLAKLGLSFSIVAGLIYPAYYVAYYMSVRQQAVNFVEEQYLARLRDGDIEKAFLLTLEPPRPSEATPSLRDTLEMEFNTREYRADLGRFTSFASSELVRLISQSGKDLKLGRPDCEAWSYRSGGFDVLLVYRFETPFVTREMFITAMSRDTSEGREWYILADASGLLRRNAVTTPAGQEFFELVAEAQGFANDWLAKVNRGDIESAYIDTLPAAQRPRHGATQTTSARPTAAGLLATLVDTKSNADFRNGLRAFRSGSLVKAEPPVFWAFTSARKRIVANAARFFDPQAEPRPVGAIVPAKLPLWDTANDATRIRFDVQLTSEFRIDAFLVLSTPKKPPGVLARRIWQVEALELVRGRPEATTPTLRPASSQRK